MRPTALRGTDNRRGCASAIRLSLMSFDESEAYPLFDAVDFRACLPLFHTSRQNFVFFRLDFKES